jgi:hypothetical protein
MELMCVQISFMTSIRHECHKIHAFTSLQATVTRASLLPDGNSMSSSSRALLFSNARHGMRSMKSGRGEWSIQRSQSNSKLASGRCNIRVHASDTTTSSENKIEVVYNPQKRINELTMELNSSSSMAVSNLTLFSPSKVCTM